MVSPWRVQSGETLGKATVRCDRERTDIIRRLDGARRRRPGFTENAITGRPAGHESEHHGKTLRNLRERPRRGPQHQPRAQHHPSPVRTEPSAGAGARERRHPTAARVHALPPIQQGHQGSLGAPSGGSSPSAPAAIGPYSQAIRSGSLLFVSGRIPMNPATGALVQGDIAAQTHRVFKNLAAISKPPTPRSMTSSAPQCTSRT